MKNQEETVKLDRAEVWVADEKEQVYFTVTFTLPRVGTTTARFHADRYVVSTWSNDGLKPDGKRWTEWRFICQDNPAGIGPKTRDAMYKLVEPVLKKWVEQSPQYFVGYQTALAHYVIRELRESRYGVKKEAFEKYRAHLSFKDQTRIAQAIDHLEAAQALLDDK